MIRPIAYLALVGGGSRTTYTKNGEIFLAVPNGQGREELHRQVTKSAQLG